MAPTVAGQVTTPEPFTAWKPFNLPLLDIIHHENMMLKAFICPSLLDQASSGMHLQVTLGLFMTFRLPGSRYLGAQAFAAAAPKAYVPGQGIATRTAVGGAGAGRSMVAGGAYKPPGAKAGGGPSGGGGRSLADLAGESTAGGAASRPARMQRGGPVGGFVEDDKPMSKNAAKNAKKKAKAAAAKAAMAEGGVAAVRLFGALFLATFLGLHLGVFFLF